MQLGFVILLPRKCTLLTGLEPFWKLDIFEDYGHNKTMGIFLVYVHDDIIQARMKQIMKRVKDCNKVTKDYDWVITNKLYY